MTKPIGDLEQTLSEAISAMTADQKAFWVCSLLSGGKEISGDDLIMWRTYMNSASNKIG